MSAAAMTTGDPHRLTGRSFRIQFRPEADMAGGVCSGRIEHVRSGDAAHFSTIEELLSFVDFWLIRQAAIAKHAPRRGVRRAKG